MNDIMRGLDDLKFAFMLGIPIYAVIFLLMYALKKRKAISVQCVPELLLCSYAVFLIKEVGLASLHFNTGDIMTYHLVPFLGCTFLPVFLNFLLFLPFGFLIPLVFPSCKWSWKKIACLGGLTSLLIEGLQMIGGRNAEIDDLLMNTLGAFTGYVLYSGIRSFKTDARKTRRSLAILAAALVVCFSGIYLLSDRSEPQPDGFIATADSIADIQLHYQGKSQAADPQSEVFPAFADQMSNCGGHLLQSKELADSNVFNTEDCFIEIRFTQPQDVKFENAAGFMITDADVVIYNCDQNILYWGNTERQYSVDYTVLDDQLEEHRADVLAQYRELREMVVQAIE